MKYDRFTGKEIKEGEAEEQHVCKMCLNCKSITGVDEECYKCTNESVMKIGMDKILAAVPEGYEIDTITLKPMTLKDPTKKCRNYCPDTDFILQTINSELA